MPDLSSISTDASIPLGFQPQQQQNPLATLGQFAGTANVLTQNRLLQQQLLARQGMTSAVQQSVDPTTGQVDTNKLLALTGQDPRTAWNFNDINAQTQANSSATSAASVAQLQSALAHLQAGNSIISASLADPRLGKTDMRKALVGSIATMLSHGDSMMTPQQAASLAASIPDDPAAQLQFVQSRANQNLALQGHIESILGAPSPVNTGNQIDITRTPAAGGPTTMAGALPTNLSPADLASPRSWVDPATNQQMTGTLAQYLQKFGGAGNTAQPPSSGVSNLPTPTSQGSNTGVRPLGNGSGAAPPPGPLSQATADVISPANAPASTGGAPAAPPPGFTSAAEAAGTASGTALGEAYKTAAGYPQRMFQLRQALTGLQGAGSTGPGTDTRNTIMSYVQSLPVVGPAAMAAAKAVGVSSPQEIADYDTSNKYLTQYAMNQAGSMGAGTDQKLATAITGNANTHISNLAAIDVVKANMALEHMKQAGVLAFNRSGQPPQNFNRFMSNWSSTVDPRAFAIETMAPADQKKLLSSLKPAEISKFKNSYNLAVNTGLIPDMAAGQ